METAGFGLLRTLGPLKTFTRTLIRRKPKMTHPGYVQYPGIKYYPRYPGEKDPEITPSKLLLVMRIKRVKGIPWWDKDTLKEFKIEEEVGPVVLKNIPEITAKLWKIKHLIRIQPIVFPYGEPGENDLKHTVLLENGQCIVKKELEIPEPCIQAKEDFEQDPTVLSKPSIEKETRLRWLNPFTGGF